MRYKGVHISMYVEHMNYHEVDDDGKYTDNIVEYDHEPQIKYWDLFGEFIDETTLLDINKYPKIEDVKNYIDEMEKRS